MQKVTDNFIKGVESKIDECSSIAQLQEIFNRYKPYIYNDYIYNSFLNRVDFFISRSVDNFITGMCENLKEDLHLERVIVQVSTTKKAMLQIDMVFNTDEGKILDDCISELFRLVLNMAQGRKQEACRLLGIDLETFDMISENKYNQFIKGIKKQMRSKKIK